MDLVDLRGCTAPGPITRVTLCGAPWILMRRTRLQSFGRYWLFDAPVMRRAKTSDHKLAFAVKIVLTHVRLVEVDGPVHVRGRIATQTPASAVVFGGQGAPCFVVPPPGYDPLATATPCPTCPRRHWHPVVAPVVYDPALFAKVRGLEIGIEFGASLRVGKSDYQEESDVGWADEAKW